MPTIIIAHMANTNANSMAFQGAFAGAMIPRPAGIIRNPLMSMPPMFMSAPSQSTQPGEGGGDNDAVAPQHCFESSLSHGRVAGIASATGYPPQDYLGRNAVTDWTSGSARNARFCQNYPIASRDR